MKIQIQRTGKKITAFGFKLDKFNFAKCGSILTVNISNKIVLDKVGCNLKLKFFKFTWTRAVI